MGHYEEKSGYTFLCMTMVLSMGACGTDSDKKASTQQGTQETASEVFDGPHSAQMKLDLSKLVTKLADYKGIDVTISGNYDVTDDQVEQNLMSLLSYYGITGVEVKDRDTVQRMIMSRWIIPDISTGMHLMAVLRQTQ